MIMTYLESQFMSEGLKIPLGLDCLFLGQDLLEVYKQQVNVVIYEDYL